MATEQFQIRERWSRWFSPADYRAHVAEEYPDTPKAIETLSIIEHVERMAGALR